MIPNRWRPQDQAVHIATLTGSTITAAQFNETTDILFMPPATTTQTGPTAAAVAAFVTAAGEITTNYIFWHNIQNGIGAPLTINLGSGFTPSSIVIPTGAIVRYEWRFDPTGLLLTSFPWQAPGDPLGSLTSITASTGITLTPNPITGTGTVGITPTGVTAQTYVSLSDVAVNAQGQVTSVGVNGLPAASATFNTGSVANNAAIAFSNGNSNTPDITIGATGSTFIINTSGNYSINATITCSAGSGNIWVWYDVTAAAVVFHPFGTATAALLLGFPTVASYNAVNALTAGHTYEIKSAEPGHNSQTVYSPSSFPASGVSAGGDLGIMRIS